MLITFKVLHHSFRLFFGLPTRLIGKLWIRPTTEVLECHGRCLPVAASVMKMGSQKTE